MNISRRGLLAAMLSLPLLKIGCGSGDNGTSVNTDTYGYDKSQIIDMHLHFFNGCYTPILGVIKAYVSFSAVANYVAGRFIDTADCGFGPPAGLPAASQNFRKKLARREKESDSDFIKRIITPSLEEIDTVLATRYPVTGDRGGRHINLREELGSVKTEFSRTAKLMKGSREFLAEKKIDEPVAFHEWDPSLQVEYLQRRDVDMPETFKKWDPRLQREFIAEKKIDSDFKNWDRSLQVEFIREKGIELQTTFPNWDPALEKETEEELDILVNYIQNGSRGGLPFQGDKERVVEAFGIAIYNILALLDHDRTLWLGLLLGSQQEILDRLFVDMEPVQTFVHEMIDMDVLIDPDDEDVARLDRASRVEKVIQGVEYAETHGRTIYPFLGYNPRFVDSFNTIKRELVDTPEADRRFMGVKFYPPLGYKPVDDNPAYNTANRNLFQLCEENEIPIFAHSQEDSLRAKNNFIKYANPENWIPVLETWPNLRLFLGHAGGMKKVTTFNRGRIYNGWLASQPGPYDDFIGSWAHTVVKLCCKYSNVYCGFGAYREIENDQNMQALKQNLIRVLNGDGLPDIESHEKFLSRVCYGSDWHMIYGHDHQDISEEYVNRFINLFSEEPLKPYQDNFMFKNAKAFLRLT